MGPVIPEIWLQKKSYRDRIRTRHILICRILIRSIIFGGRIFTSATLQSPEILAIFCVYSGRARVCWPLRCLCRPFCIFERCLDSNAERCRSRQARYQLSHPSPWLSHPPPWLSHPPPYLARISVATLYLIGTGYMIKAHLAVFILQINNLIGIDWLLVQRRNGTTAGPGYLEVNVICPCKSPHWAVDCSVRTVDPHWGRMAQFLCWLV